MKIIFLDIDGVMNSMIYYEKYSECPMLEKQKISFLHEIIDETKALIVLTTKRKMFPSFVKNIVDEFNENGFYIYDLTKEIGNKDEEIKEWLTRNKNVENFVIVDDNDFNFSKQYKDRFVKTFNRYGLTRSKTNKIIKILNEPKMP